MRRVLAATLAFHAGAALAESGFYTGAGVGFYEDDFTAGGVVDVEIDRTDFRVFHGYRFNDFLSLQADVIRSGFDVEADGVVVEEARPWLGEVSVKPSLPIGNQRVQVYARAGYAFDIRDDVDAFDIDISDWSWAGGVEVFIDERWAVRAEYYGIDWSSDAFENGSFGVAFTYNMRDPR